MGGHEVDGLVVDDPAEVLGQVVHQLLGFGIEEPLGEVVEAARIAVDDVAPVPEGAEHPLVLSLHDAPLVQAVGDASLHCGGDGVDVLDEGHAVESAEVDDQGRGIWFGTWGGGLSLFDGVDTWTNYTTADGLPGNVIYALAESPDGILWIGTNRGVAAYDGTQFRHYAIDRPVRDVYALEIAPDGAVWAGTRGAVLRLSYEN